MYSPKELEEEVDHSFFDSDCEADRAEDGRLNKQEASQRADVREGKETHVLKDQIGTEVQSGGNGKDKARLEDGLHQESRRGNTEEQERIIKGQSSDLLFKGSSPISSTKSSETGDNSQTDEGSSVQSYSSDEERELDDEDNGVPKPRKNSNGDINSDDDGYHRSNDESEEDNRTHSSKRRESSHGTPKKFAGKFRKLGRSHSSSSDSESSQSSAERGSVYSQRSQVKPHQSDRPKESAESEDTVTDVTPLSTPNVSPTQSIDVVLPSEPLPADIQQDVQENEDSDDLDSISSEALLKIEKQLDKVVVSTPGRAGSSRKNYSFTNEEVRRIDRENQRLLHNLSCSSACSRSASSTFSSTSSWKSSAPPVRLYHSAVNRQKQQERIQKENLAFLKRLESVKATPGLTRDEQLTDYQRQCGYLGMDVTTIPPLKSKSSKTSGRTSRPCSSPHKARPETAKLNRATPRPAWS